MYQFVQQYFLTSIIYENMPDEIEKSPSMSRYYTTERFDIEQSMAGVGLEVGSLEVFLKIL